MSAWDPSGKYAIVTGAGGGIALAFAEKLLDSGASVVLADIALRPEAEALLAKFPHPPQDGAPSAVYSKLDQSDWSQISATWEFALKTFGRVDLLCPGAGIWEPPTSGFWHPPGVSPLSKDDPNSAPGVYHIFAVNLMGPIRFAQIAIDYWLENKIAGNLLAISSMGAYLPTATTPHYNATKGALNSFIQSLAQFRTRLGIRTAAICPGVTATPATRQEYCKHLVPETEITLTPAQVADVMLKVASEAEYGDGNIVETVQIGTKDEPKVNVRTVPYQTLLPPLDFTGDFSGKTIITEEETLWQKLQTTGMKPS